MTAPAAAVTLCKCGHGRPRHDGELAPQCSSPSCTCLHYRADDGTPPPVRVVPTPTAAAASLPPRGAAAVPPAAGGPSIEQLLAAGKRSASKRVATLAERIEGLVATLASAVRDERQAAEAKRRADAEKEAARREVAELETRLAAARAKLPRRTPPATKSAGTGACPDCGKTGLNNVGAHRYRSHGTKAS